jgi:hypothetical protein
MRRLGLHTSRAPGTFAWLGSNPTLESRGAAFTGGNASGTASIAASVLHVVADDSTSIPSGNGTFTGFADGRTVRGTGVAFRAEGSNARKASTTWAPTG